MYHPDLEEFFEEKVFTCYFPDRAPGTWMKFHPPTIGDEIDRVKLYKEMPTKEYCACGLGGELEPIWWLKLAVLELSLLYLDTNIGDLHDLEGGANRERIEEFFRSFPMAVIEEIWNCIPYSDWGKVAADRRLSDFNPGTPL
jgi:hypothetical protein